MGGREVAHRIHGVNEYNECSLFLLVCAWDVGCICFFLKEYCDMSSTSVKWRKQSGDQTFWSCFSGIVCPLRQYQVLQVLVVFVPHRMKTSIPALLFLGMQ
jgi:ABC-type uncharacterized transport system permease subunit